MELKPGYKQTEAGVIPEEWEVKPLGIAADVVMGQSPVGSSYNRRGIGPPLINGPTEFTDKHPSKIQWTSEPTKLCKKGDLLLCVRGSSTGRMNISDDNYCIGRGVAAIRAKSEADASFITFQVDSALSNILALTTGSTFPNIDGKSIRAIEIRLPPLPEQRSIAAALSDVDALIGALDQLIAKKRDVKRAAMQQLLTGQHRLPGFHGKWEVKRFGEISALRKERVDPRKAGAQEFCVELEHIEQSSGRLIGSNSAGEESSLKSVFLAGDVLFGKLRAYLRKYWRADRDGVCSTEIWVLVPNEQLVTPDFLFHLVTVDQFIEAASTAYGTHMPRSDWHVVKNYEIALPKPDEQTSIAGVLSDMDAEIELLEARRDKTRSLKQGMMQELLTGRTRLV